MSRVPSDPVGSPPHSDLVERFDASFARADDIISVTREIIKGGNTADLDQLRPLRLGLAGAITACQLSCHRVMAATAPTEPSYRAMKAIDDGWIRLGADYRAFVAKVQSDNAGGISSNSDILLELMLRLQVHIAQSKKCIARKIIEVNYISGSK